MSGRPRAFDPEQVLAKAMMVFWSTGYEATGIAELEQATGLGRQSLYGAFGDKRALFEKVVEFYFDRVLKPGLIDVLDAPGCARSNLEKVFLGWEELASAPEFNGCLVGNTASSFPAKDQKLSHLLARKLTLLEEAFARALRRAQKQGDVPATTDARATARCLVSLAQGLAVVARVQREPAFVKGVVDSARRLLS